MSFCHTKMWMDTEPTGCLKKSQEISLISSDVIAIYDLPIYKTVQIRPEQECENVHNKHPKPKISRRPTRINISFIPICQLSHSQRRLISVFHGKLPPQQYGSIVKKRARIQHLSSLIKYHCFVSDGVGDSASLRPFASTRVSHYGCPETISLLNWPPLYNACLCIYSCRTRGRLVAFVLYIL